MLCSHVNILHFNWARSWEKAAYMNFNKFSVSAKAASPLMPRGKDYRIHDLWWAKIYWERGDEVCCFTNCSFLIHKCNNYKGHWSYEIGLFNLSYLSSIINTLITVSTPSFGNLSILRIIIGEPNVRQRVQNSTHNTGTCYDFYIWLTGILLEAQSLKNLKLDFQCFMMLLRVCLLQSNMLLKLLLVLNHFIFGFSVIVLFNL